MAIVCGRIAVGFVKRVTIGNIYSPGSKASGFHPHKVYLVIYLHADQARSKEVATNAAILHYASTIGIEGGTPALSLLSKDATSSFYLDQRKICG